MPQPLSFTAFRDKVMRVFNRRVRFNSGVKHAQPLRIHIVFSLHL
jgi:hypothetical protein